MSEMSELETLETRLAAAKAAGDAMTVRELLPAVNAARKASRDAESARVAELSARGINPDGTPMSPEQKILAAIGF